MDISTLTYDVNKPRAYAVPDPGNDWQPSDWVIQILSEDSDAVRLAQLQVQKRLIAKAQSGGRRAASLLDADPAELKAGQVAVVVAAITDWSGLKDGDKDIAFSPKTAETLLSQPSLNWLLEDLNAQVGDLSDFLGTSKVGSKT